MEEDDWDNPAPPLSRSDRIQRITSPDSTLQRQRSHPPTTGAHLQHPHPQGFPGPHFHVGSNNSLARSAQAQQLQLAGFHPYDMGLLDPGHVATLRRQAQMLALQAQAAASHSNSLPRSANHQQPLSVPPVVSPSSSHRILNQRYKQSSLPPTAGPLRVASPSSAAQRLESALERGGHGDATLSRRGPYWGQVGPGNYDPYSVGGGGGVYPGDGSTSSYARVGQNQNNNRQTYPPQHQPLPQTAEPIYNLQHDESTSLTSQKTSRTQTSMLTKSAPTPSGSGVSGSSGAGPLPPKPAEGGSGASGSSMSASAKYAEYLSSLEKYQHPPPSKRHVTFSKYRGRQCTMGMLAVFALLVVGLVVAPVVYFTAFANKTQSSEASTETRLTSFINGQITLDTTHGAYADLITDPARPNKDNDNAGLRRVQRDMEELLKDVLLHGAGGFAADEVSSVMVSQPQRPDTHQIFLRFQVLLKGAMPLDLAEAKTSKAFASATTTDPLGTNLNTVPIIANSLFYRAVPQTNASNAANEQLLQPLTDVDALPPPHSRPSDAPSGPKRGGVPARLSTVGNSPATQPTLLMTPPSPPPPASSPPPTTRTTTPATTTRTTPTTTKRTTTTTALMNVNPDDENFSVAGKVPNRKNTRPPVTPVPEAPTFAFTLPPLTTSPITPPPPAPSVFTRPETTQFIKFTPPPQEMFPIRDFSPNMERDRGFTAPADNVAPLSGWPVTRPQGMPLQETPHFTGPQFVQVFDPHAGTTPDMQHNFPNQPEQFSPNMQPSQFGPNIQPAQFGPNMQPSQFGPNMQPSQFGPNNQPAQFSPNFPPPPAPDMNGNRQLGPIDNAFHPLPGPGPIVPFSRFSLDDASAATASEASVVTTLRTEPIAKTTVATTTKTTTPTTTILTTTQKSAGEVTREPEERTLAPEKREFSGTADGNLPSRAGEFVKDGMDFGDSFASTAPLLVSEWGNWSEWGACSAPRCSAEGFQMRTRACMTSINGAVPLADHDASCSVNGGQGIEARPCLCDTPPAVTEMPPEDETFLPDPVPSTVAIVTTAKTIPVAWSEWTDWSSCSIAPCHAQGIQTRHRTCRVEGSSGQQVPEEACLSGDGAAVETRVCECAEALQTVTPPAGESEVVTTPTFVRPSSAGREGVVQPQRTFSMQVQNRPLQKRPLVSSSNNLPRTCSFYEKPCNNGQCILSYRVCDGFPDCSDGSDEPLGCGRCFSGEFKCTNGRCISESLVCDGKDNCGDGTDEFFC